MYKIGDHVLYGALGVMKIEDIKDEVILGERKTYYVLSDIVGSESRTYVPFDNEKLVGNMKPLLTPEEIYELLASYDSLPELEWQRDSRVRQDRFKRVIESSDRAGLLSLIKTVKRVAKEREAQGKRGYVADENAAKKARRLLNEELSFVLGDGKLDLDELLEK